MFHILSGLTRRLLLLLLLCPALSVRRLSRIRCVGTTHVIVDSSRSQLECRRTGSRMTEEEKATRVDGELMCRRGVAANKRLESCSQKSCEVVMSVLAPSLFGRQCSLDQWE